MFKKLARTKSVAVKFVGDDDVIQNIASVNSKRIRRKNGDIVYDHSHADVAPLSPSSDNDYQVPSALCPTQNETEGKDLFQFSKQSLMRTPTSGRKNLQNGHKDSPVSTPKSVSKTPKSNGKTPKSNGKTPKSIIKTPKSSAKTPNSALTRTTPSSNSLDTNSKSPYSLRGGIKKAIFCDDYDSDPEESDLEDSDESCSDAEDSGSQKKNMNNFAEGYFVAQKNTKAATSNHTLSKISLPKTNIQDLQDLLQNSSQEHRKDKRRLYKEYKNQFKKWRFQLQNGFNILLYGIGSKMKLMQKIRANCLSELMAVEISGFHPSLTIKQVLNTITEDVIGHDGSFPNIFDHTEFVKDYFESEEKDFYLLVHNIDGFSLRSVKCQAVLASLASSAKIHVIASVDHINCSLVWDQIMLSQFRWIWQHVPTYEPYILETSYENSLLRKQSNLLLLSSLLHVFQSLTPNNRGVFLIIAKHQLNKKDNSQYLGMTFQEWYQECREAFLVSSESTMNAQMSEFKNHKLLSSRKSSDGIEYWYIPVDGNTLEQFLERDEIQ